MSQSNPDDQQELFSGPTAFADRRFFLRIPDLMQDQKANRILKGLGIEFVGQLVLQKERNLLRVPSFGRKTLTNIRKALGKFDLDINLDEPEWGMLDSDEINSEFDHEIKAAASWIARKRRPLSLNYLEDEMQQLLSVIEDNRNREIITRRLGLNGKKRQTLQRIADDMGGLTRERIRQIVDSYNRKITQRSWHLPILDKAISLTLSKVPCSEHEIQEELMNSGICRTEFAVEGIVEIAGLLDKNLQITNGGPKFRSVWVQKSQNISAKKVQTLAKKLMSSSGLATFELIADEIGRQEGVKISNGFVESIVETQPQFRILDLHSGWFWFYTNRNRLINTLRKIFSVAERVHVSEVRLAVQRFRRLEGFAPPQRVLLSLCKNLPDFDVDDDFIVRVPGVKTTGWIEGVDQLFASVLTEYGGVLDRIKLEEECLKKGMNEHTFAIYLHGSPIMLKLGRGVFGLVGADTTAEEISSMELRRPKFKAVSNYEWCANGALRVDYRITDNMLYTGFFPVPGPICEYLESPFELVNSNGEKLGIIKTKGHIGWSLKKLFRTMGGDGGDPFSLTFDLSNKIAVMEFNDTNQMT